MFVGCLFFVNKRGIIVIIKKGLVVILFDWERIVIILIKVVKINYCSFIKLYLYIKVSFFLVIVVLIIYKKIFFV